ncbi:hypothetical protein V3C99_011523, partial [Haemonchus contortus]
VDQFLDVGDPDAVQDIDQVVNDIQLGSPPPPVPVDSTDPSVGILWCSMTLRLSMMKNLLTAK